MALIVFKCRAAADIMMIEKDAKPILDLLGKDLKKGVITAAEAPAAAKKIEDQIEKLKQLEQMTTLERVKLEQKAAKKPVNGNEEREKEDGPRIGFATRSYPFLQMLKAAIREEKNIMWGV